MLYVFNTEGDGEILGPYDRTDEDVVFYVKPGSANCDSPEFGQAPADCVTVKEVTRSEVQDEIARLKRQLDEASWWIGGDYVTAMNSVLAVGVQLIQYAQVMGARLTVDTATREHFRKVESDGYYIGSRAHSRQFETSAV